MTLSYIRVRLYSYLYSIILLFLIIVDDSVHIFMQILPNLFHATCNANGILSRYNV